MYFPVHQPESNGRLGERRSGAPDRPPARPPAPRSPVPQRPPQPQRPPPPGSHPQHGMNEPFFLSFCLVFGIDNEL